ncbi:MAG: hypothetical protein KKD21_03560 [Proteobacteria bacterium]|nr:hypothetical protein [Pseudomonadota bacterium]
MSASKDLERLVQEIADSRNERMVFIENLKNESLNLIKSLSRDRDNMTQSLHQQLKKYRPALDAMEKERQKEALMENNKRREWDKDRKNEALKERDQRIKWNNEVLENFMSEFHNDSQADKQQRLEGVKTLKDDSQADKQQRLKGIKTLKAEVSRMRGDIQNWLKNMRDELSPPLKAFVSDLKASEKDRKSSEQAELAAMAAAWRKKPSRVSLSDPETIQEIVEPEPLKEVDTSEEPEEQTQPDEEVETEHSYYDNAPLKETVMSTLFDYADGLKMTQLAELLDIEQWRMLIPVMRDLMDSKQIRKEGSLYFTL